jgi:alanine dehydrogenase
MAAGIGAQLLKMPGPGRGKLLGGIPGVEPARAVVLGSGSVATAACDVLVALEASVIAISRHQQRLSLLQDRYKGRISTQVSTPAVLARELHGADLLIAAILVLGAAAPKVVSREMVRSMGPGAVIVDVSIDQGGAVETSRPTSHADPWYVEEGVVHYCVTNMPGAVPRTATEALAEATLPYLLQLAEGGLEAVKRDTAFAAGVNVIDGKLTCRPVAEALGLAYTPLAEAVAK